MRQARRTTSNCSEGVSVAPPAGWSSHLLSGPSLTRLHTNRRAAYHAGCWYKPITFPSGSRNLAVNLRCVGANGLHNLTLVSDDGIERCSNAVDHHIEQSAKCGAGRGRAITQSHSPPRLYRQRPHSVFPCQAALTPTVRETC